MTATIGSLDQAKKVIDLYLLDDRPLNLSEMRALNDQITNALNEMKQCLRCCQFPQELAPLFFQMKKRCGMP